MLERSREVDLGFEEFIRAYLVLQLEVLLMSGINLHGLVQHLRQVRIVQLGHVVAPALVHLLIVNHHLLLLLLRLHRCHGLIITLHFIIVHSILSKIS